MTHNTPHDKDLRWCEHCQLSVEPSPGDAGPECPSCGEAL
jgi:predicted RNA-binding Zn-ribbon protein involved in translation (DUF1610 family)